MILIAHYVLFVLNPACLCCHSIINVCVCKEEDSDGRAKVTTEEAGPWRLFQHKLSIQHHTENDNLFIFMLTFSSGFV